MVFYNYGFIFLHKVKKLACNRRTRTELYILKVALICKMLKLSIILIPGHYEKSSISGIYFLFHFFYSFFKTLFLLKYAAYCLATMLALSCFSYNWIIGHAVNKFLIGSFSQELIKMLKCCERWASIRFGCNNSIRRHHQFQIWVQTYHASLINNCGLVPHLGFIPKCTTIKCEVLHFNVTIAYSNCRQKAVLTSTVLLVLWFTSQFYYPKSIFERFFSQILLLIKTLPMSTHHRS